MTHETKPLATDVDMETVTHGTDSSVEELLEMTTNLFLNMNIEVPPDNDSSHYPRYKDRLHAVEHCLLALREVMVRLQQCYKNVTERSRLNKQEVLAINWKSVHENNVLFHTAIDKLCAILAMYEEDIKAKESSLTGNHLRTPEIIQEEQTLKDRTQQLQNLISYLKETMGDINEIVTKYSQVTDSR